MALLQYAIDVIEGISATVSGGVYNLVSHTPVNPLLLDSTAQNLLEQMAGTSLEVLKNDLGETIGYAAKGVANAGNGAATEVSTRIAVLTKETVVDAEMAAGSYIEASTGAAAELTVGETVTEVSAAGTGAGILATEVGAAGAAIAPALGLVAGFALYNIAPEFWESVSEQLVAAGETIGGKVIGLVNSDNTTSYSNETIEIYKNAFLEAGYFDSKLTYEATELSETLSLYDDVQWPLIGANSGEIIVNSGYGWFGPYPSKYQVVSNSNDYKMAGFYSANRRNIRVLAVSESTLQLFLVNANNGNASTGATLSFTLNGKQFYYSALYTEYGVDIEGNITGALNKMLIDIGNTSGQQCAELLASTITKSDSKTQSGATLPTEDPFPQTYPDWQPNKTIQGKDYYPVSEPTPDSTQAPSQTGANDTDEQQDSIADKLFNPQPDPKPEPEPDPDPSPEPDPQPEIDPNTPTDPIDPNPDPDPSGGTPTLPVISGVTATKMMCVYNPTDAQVDDLGGFLWVDNIIEQIRLIFQDPMDAIISLHKIYAQPITGSSKEIVLGYIPSGVNALEVTNQFTTVDCQSVTIEEKKRNATDYAPYTSAHIYLPFIGIEELDIAEIMNGTVNVKYRVDAYTGTCVAQIFVTRSKDMPNAQMLYTFSGNASQTIPLTSGNFTGLVSSLVSIAGGAVTSGPGGAFLAAGHALSSHMASVSHSGGLSANAGIMGPRKPFIILSRQNGFDANGYNSQYGFPANKTVYIGNLVKGSYNRIKSIRLYGFGTDEEKAEIERILKEGFIA